MLKNLQTPRLTLRHLSPTDAEAILALRSNESINQYLARPKTTTIEEAQQFIQKIQIGIAHDGWLYWGIALKKSDTIIGTFCFWNMEKANGLAEIGYELHPDFQGKGIMHEVLTKMMDVGFKKMQFQTIVAFTNCENTKSIQLLLKKGFEKVADFEEIDAEHPIIYWKYELKKADILR
jgi:[ribosomal protein S5]-alanine N-acetyltransferase